MILVGEATPTAGHGASEPVLVSLSAPARRSLVDGLIGPPGSVPNAPILAADASDAEIADFLAGVVHADTGFVARTDDGERALAVVAATAAALCGEDIRGALVQPDVEFLVGLKPPAVEAVRGVLLAVETVAPDRVGEVLAVLRR